jgi:hypothetical protein
MARSTTKRSAEDEPLTDREEEEVEVSSIDPQHGEL